MRSSSARTIWVKCPTIPSKIGNKCGRPKIGKCRLNATKPRCRRHNRIVETSPTVLVWTILAFLRAKKPCWKPQTRAEFFVSNALHQCVGEFVQIGHQRGHWTTCSSSANAFASSCQRGRWQMGAWHQTTKCARKRPLLRLAAMGWCVDAMLVNNWRLLRKNHCDLKIRPNLHHWPCWCLNSWCVLSILIKQVCAILWATICIVNIWYGYGVIRYFNI